MFLERASDYAGCGSIINTNIACLEKFKDDIKAYECNGSIFVESRAKVIGTASWKLNMIIIPKKPKESRTLGYIKKIPLPLQALLVLILLSFAWQFRYYNSGVSAESLQKVQGILYEVSCLKSITGSDTIRLRTSLQKETLTFSGWQKCNNINWLMAPAGNVSQAVFYVNIKRVPLNHSSKGSMHIYAIDLIAPFEGKFIYPANGLEVKNNPNIFGMFLFFMAVLITHSMWANYSEKRKKTKNT